MMKVLMVFVFLCTFNAYAHWDMGSNGVSKQDQYGDSWQKAPSKNEVDPSPKKCFNDLSLFDVMGEQMTTPTGQQIFKEQYDDYFPKHQPNLLKPIPEEPDWPMNSSGKISPEKGKTQETIRKLSGDILKDYYKGKQQSSPK